MEYMKQYSADDLFDMFANEADFAKLGRQDESQIASDLLDLASDMEDANDVAAHIKRQARNLALNQRFGSNRTPIG